MAMIRIETHLKAEKSVVAAVEKGRAYIDIHNLRLFLNEAETRRLHAALGAAIEHFEENQ